MRFYTNKTYSDRPSKAHYVYDKYREILTGSVLDVGADECHLKALLPAGTGYTGIDLSNFPGVERVDLEKEPIPAAVDAFQATICLDVLEHLENVHETFGELCRVTSRWLIISLPNPWSAFMQDLIAGKHQKGGNLQHYGLPLVKPAHRHKWFFAPSEASLFVETMAARHGMSIVQFDVQEAYEEVLRVPRCPADLARWKQWILMKCLFGRGTYMPDVYGQTLWWVLEKNTRMAGR